jgi:DNA (cytosine-5)-methyltransferase 1
MDDERGQLALQFLKLLDRTRARWVVWENVPGVLSSNGGRDFGSFLGGLVELGYGFAYRILDAQHFGVPQRRRRVFVVGHLGDWRRAAAVLFERHSLSGNPAPRREKGQSAPTIPSRSSAGGGLGTDFDCDGGLVANPFGGDRVFPTLDTRMDQKFGCNQWVDSGQFVMETAHSLRAEGFDASEDGTGRGTPLVPVAYQTSGNCGAWKTGDITGALDTNTDPSSHVVCFSAKDHGGDASDISPTLRAGGHSGSHANAGVMPAVAFQHTAGTLKSCGGKSGTPNGAEEADRLVGAGSAVRRLTPRECERLQGFPDDYTLIPYRGKPAVDGPRYKALGNSMAVPVMRWIGERIAKIEAIPHSIKDAA